MEILILCSHEDMIGIFSIKLIFSQWNVLFCFALLLLLEFWSDSHKYQCHSKLAQLGLSCDNCTWKTAFQNNLLWLGELFQQMG